LIGWAAEPPPAAVAAGLAVALADGLLVELVLLPPQAVAPAPSAQASRIWESTL
jgi:hypothetical protein